MGSNDFQLFTIRQSHFMSYQIYLQAILHSYQAYDANKSFWLVFYIEV